MSSTSVKKAEITQLSQQPEIDYSPNEKYEATTHFFLKESNWIMYQFYLINREYISALVNFNQFFIQLRLISFNWNI